MVWSALFAASVVVVLLDFFFVLSVFPLFSPVHAFPLVFPQVLELLSFLFLPIYACVRWKEEGTLFLPVVGVVAGLYFLSFCAYGVVLTLFSFSSGEKSL